MPSGGVCWAAEVYTDSMKPTVILIPLLLALAAVAVAAQELDRSKLPPEPAGFELGGDPEAGAKVYRQSCAVCHGPEGKGRGRIQFTEPPRDLTDPENLKTASDWELYQVIKGGGEVLGLDGKMLPWEGLLEEEEIRDVSAFVRSLSEKE